MASDLPSMAGSYDVIVLGTGIKECIISGLLSVEGKKVLQMDRNSYYGGETSSFNLEQLYELFKKKMPTNLGKSRDWSVDLTCKFVMSSGKLINMLLTAEVTHLLEFYTINGSYICKSNKICKVPADNKEAITSDLMGMFEKRRFRDFLQTCHNFDTDKNAHKTKKLVKSKDVQQIFGLEQSTMELIGHAMALHQNDEYLEKPVEDLLDKVLLYAKSLGKYGKSPYIYPYYGLSEIAQAFARHSAVYGGTFVLNREPDEILMENGIFVGLRSGQDVAKAPICIADPSYFTKLTKTLGKVVRAICLLNHPIPNCDNTESCQIILPQSQVKRKNDIYICCVSYANSIAPEGYWVAQVSTVVETNNPEDELREGIKLLGPVLETFYRITDILAPVSDGKNDKVFISKSYDSSTHFEGDVFDILDLYERITGSVFDEEKAKKKLVEFQKNTQQRLAQ